MTAFGLVVSIRFFWARIGQIQNKTVFSHVFLGSDGPNPEQNCLTVMFFWAQIGQNKTPADVWDVLNVAQVTTERYPDTFTDYD